MAKIARFNPYIYAAALRSMVVPGYNGYPGGVVALTRYVSANTLFGGASRASTLKDALKAAGDMGDKTVLASAGVARVFTGQGMPADFITVLAMVNKLREPLSKDRTLAPYFKETDFLQALLDASFIGMDCIGFVGTYLVAAGIDPAYAGRIPLEFATVFPMVQSLDQVDVGSVLMMTNGMHVQIVDWVWERSATRMVVDICQSSSHPTNDDSKGPQCNSRVVISAGGGSYLPVEEFRKLRENKTKWDEYAATDPKPTANGYEMYLRKTMTIKGYTGLGFGHGAIFQISGNGEPPNPAGGSYYIGTMPGLTFGRPEA